MENVPENKKSFNTIEQAKYASSKLGDLIEKEKKNRIKWGFVWGFLAAIIWGLGYVPSVAVWKIPDMSNSAVFPEGYTGYLVAMVAIAFGAGITKVFVTTLFWDLGESKLSDVPKALSNLRISKTLLISTLIASPIGVGGYQLAVAYAGGSFAAAASLLTGAISAIVANLWYREKLNKKTMIGIAFIAIGGVFVFNPYALIEDIANPATKDAWIGYVGGILAALAWGLEGVFVARVADVYDYSMNMTCRGIFDFFWWTFLCLPLAILFFGFDTMIGAMAHIYMHPAYWIWEILYVMSLFSAYVGMYRAFPLIGAGRGMSISMLYIIPGFLTLYFFMGDVLKWWIVAGSALAVFGTIYMYWESSDSMTEGTRVIDEA